MPLNYQYAVSSWIYRKIQEADPEYSLFLHQNGYESGDRRYKLFTFSKIESYPYAIIGDRMELKGDFASIILSFMADRAAENAIRGIFQDQIMPIKDPIGGVEFRILRIEAAPYPEFSEEMTYRTISPICISFRSLMDKQPKYLHPDDGRYRDLMIANLVRKYAALQLAEAGAIMATSDSPAIAFEMVSPPRQKLTTIKPYTGEESKVRAYEYRFRLKAPIELQKTGYYAGFGEKNSMGFGCVEIVEG